MISRNSTKEGSLLMHTPYIILYMPRTSLADSHQYFKITSGRLICLSKTLPYVKEIVWSEEITSPWNERTGFDSYASHVGDVSS